MLISSMSSILAKVLNHGKNYKQWKKSVKGLKAVDIGSRRLIKRNPSANTQFMKRDWMYCVALLTGRAWLALPARM